MTRIAVLCEDDPIWALATWERTLPALAAADLTPLALWVAPPVLGRHTKRAIPRWYLQTFGVVDFVKMGLFAVTARIARIFDKLRGRRAGDFESLSRRHGIAFDRCSSPNDSRFISWLKDSQIDILVIMVGNILNKDILNAPRMGSINKHAAVLPANRGLFPFLWARLADTPQGVTFHEVVEGIDEGRILVQKRFGDASMFISMVGFYFRVFEQYPWMLLTAIHALVDGRFLPPPEDVTSSYFGLPSADDVRRFRERGGVVIAWSDIIKSVHL